MINLKLSFSIIVAFFMGSIITLSYKNDDVLRLETTINSLNQQLIEIKRESKVATKITAPKKKTSLKIRSVDSLKEQSTREVIINEQDITYYSRQAKMKGNTQLGNMNVTRPSAMDENQRRMDLYSKVAEMELAARRAKKNQKYTKSIIQ